MNTAHKTEEEKVLIAYYLTCEYLSECDYHYQEMLFFERLFFIIIQKYFHCSVDIFQKKCPCC
jgi:hypothetical protein